MDVTEMKRRHEAVDSLLAEYLHSHPTAMPSRTSVLQLLEWSNSRSGAEGEQETIGGNHKGCPAPNDSEPEVPKTLKQKIAHWGFPIAFCTIFGFGAAMLGRFARPGLDRNTLLAMTTTFTLAGTLAGMVAAALDYRLRTK